MTSSVLFIHGAGQGAYDADLLLAQSLEKELGSHFSVIYPRMTDEANAPYEIWKQQIQEGIAKAEGPVIVAGHSMGASELAKALTEIKITTPIAGIFLLAPPYWGGKGWLYEGYEELELPENTAAQFPKAAKVFLYHARDDEIVPFSHQALYAGLLPRATVREITIVDNDLSLMAKDMKNLDD